MINLALEGKIDFLKKTNPWGSSEEKPDDDWQKQKPDPEGAAKKFIAMMKARGAKPLPRKTSA